MGSYNNSFLIGIGFIMKDNEKPVKSTISMSLDPKKIKGIATKPNEGADTAGIQANTTNKVSDDTLGGSNQVNDAKVGTGKTTTQNSSNTDHRAAHVSHNHNHNHNPKASSSTPHAAVLPNNPWDTERSSILKALFVVLIASIFMMLGSSLYHSAGHYYYVESTIQLPSKDETLQNALILNSCVRDYSEVATPDSLIALVQSEYNYTKGENDLVQNLVSTGCDIKANPSILTTGSLLQAIF